MSDPFHLERVLKASFKANSKLLLPVWGCADETLLFSGSVWIISHIIEVDIKHPQHMLDFEKNRPSLSTTGSSHILQLGHLFFGLGIICLPGAISLKSFPQQASHKSRAWVVSGSFPPWHPSNQQAPPAQLIPVSPGQPAWDSEWLRL